MSIRLEMLQVARLAPKLLGESAELVRGFLSRQQNDDGGFRGRTNQADLYYTVFGLDGLLALDASRPGIGHEPGVEPAAAVFERARAYLQTLGDGDGLDFVHLCCLARCWASCATFARAGEGGLDRIRSPLQTRIERFRSRDGGYSAVPGGEHGTAYACFLGLGAAQDLQRKLPDPSGLARCLKTLETQDGAWTNERFDSPATRPLPPGHSSVPILTVGSTNATAAAVTLLRNLDEPSNPRTADWLLARAHPQGGFLATPNAPIPDLLSTATALHALAGLQASFHHLKEPSLDFIDSLWTNEGAFYGHWHDDHLDCEYTYYALLALGHLSLSQAG